MTFNELIAKLNRFREKNNTVSREIVIETGDEIQRKPITITDDGHRIVIEVE